MIAEALYNSNQSLNKHGKNFPILWVSFRKGNGIDAPKVPMLDKFLLHVPRSDYSTNKLADGL